MVAIVNEWTCTICGEKSKKSYCLECGTPRGHKIEIKKTQSKAISINASDLIDRLRKKYDNINGVYFKSDNEKAKKKLNAAMSSYGKSIDKHNESVILCYDDTMFGSASDGCILTSKGVYIHNLGEDNVFVDYKDIKNVSLDEKNIFINGEIKISVICTTDAGRKSFCELLNEVSALLKKQSGSSSNNDHRFCGNCGSVVARDSKFCGKCGNKVQ